MRRIAPAAVLVLHSGNAPERSVTEPVFDAVVEKPAGIQDVVALLGRLIRPA